ncbi:hypothetical protein NLU13_6310 [Sarocladium strictum]|uniref:Uncharacterized protein n=1 Tax=Sarocladium strictum TaxID=5046 RepID=A0AA39GFN2_SARSR|nr:hypothetical protein NLU13_6310 [Sarocladium strictum]
MPTTKPTLQVSPEDETSSGSDRDSQQGKQNAGNKDATGLSPPGPLDLATRETVRMEAALGDAILRFLRIRKTPKSDDIWDSENVEEYRRLYIHPQWENASAFDPGFRWTFREENQVRRKVDWKIMLWVCIMFAALNIDRGNISNAVSDNMLDDLGLTQSDYNIGQTIARLGFLVAELPSQLISKRIGPDLWIPIQICIFSAISALQFFLNGAASFYATRYLIRGTLVDERSSWLRWLALAVPDRVRLVCNLLSQVSLMLTPTSRGAFTCRPMTIFQLGRNGFLTRHVVAIGLASFFLMPQSPARTKSKLFPKGYFTEREEKIIVNAVIRDDPQKAGMHNRQGLTVGQIWKCAKDYTMWPLYMLGLLFGLPKYPVGQYLTLSFRGLGFNTVGGSITMLLITAFSELVRNRGFVSMAQDAWLLPCFIALITLPDPIGAWAYFAIATVLLSAPYTHPIQVAWTSRNAGSVQNRTVSAALYNMAVQVSGMIGANTHKFVYIIYQPSDAPRYFKANKGLLVICFWMCFIQYPGTYFFYRWRNRSKAKVWDAMTPEEQHHYRTTTTDEGNKRLDFRYAT